MKLTTLPDCCLTSPMAQRSLISFAPLTQQTLFVVLCLLLFSVNAAALSPYDAKHNSTTRNGKVYELRNFNDVMEFFVLNVSRCNPECIFYFYAKPMITIPEGNKVNITFRTDLNVPYQLYNASNARMSGNTIQVYGAIELDYYLKFTPNSATSAKFNVSLDLNGLYTLTIDPYIDIYTGINFSDPTPANGTSTSNNWIDININITNTSALLYFNYTFDNVSYSVYNSALGLMLNFDNITTRNEDNTFVNDSSPSPVTVESFNIATTDDAVFVKAVEFNGIDTMMNTSVHPVSLSNQLHSIIFWFKTRNTSANQTLFEHGADTKGHGIYIVDGELQYIYRKGAGTFEIINYTGLQNDSWYNVMATMIYTNDTILLYVNGTLEATTVVVPIASAPSEYVGIGYSPDTNVYTGNTDHWHTDGVIDEVFYFDVPLFFEEALGRDFMGNFRCEDVNVWRWIRNETGLSTGLYWFWGEAESVGGSYNRTDYRAVQVDGVLQSSSSSTSSSTSSSSSSSITSSSELSSSLSSSSISSSSSSSENSISSTSSQSSSSSESSSTSELASTSTSELSSSSSSSLAVASSSSSSSFSSSLISSSSSSSIYASTSSSVISSSSSSISSSSSSSSSSNSLIATTTTTLIEYCNSYRVMTFASPYLNASCSDMQTNETCFDKYQAAEPLNLYRLNYSNCEWNGSECITDMTNSCIILVGTTTTTTTTLCNMKITSAEPGIDLCLGDYCNSMQCVAGNRDYFGTWKYSGLKIDREYTPEQAIWMAAFMLIFMALLMFAGVMISTVLSLTAKIMRH